MAELLGRAITFVSAGSPLVGTVLTGMRSKSLTVQGEAIDITTDDTSGWQEFLVSAPRLGYTLEVSGITKDTNILDAVETSGVAALENYVLDFGALSKTVTGNWVLSNVSFGIEYEDAVTFTCTIQSDGVMEVA